MCNYAPTEPLKTIKTSSHDNDTARMIVDGHGGHATIALMVQLTNTFDVPTTTKRMTTLLLARTD